MTRHDADIEGRLPGRVTTVTQSVGYKRSLPADILGQAIGCQAGIIENAAGDRRPLIVNHRGKDVTIVVEAYRQRFDLTIFAKGLAMRKIASADMAHPVRPCEQA